jgi:DNA (cytosine-5)-methyltransferase 1
MSPKAQPNQSATPLPIDPGALDRERETAIAAKKARADQMVAGIKDAGGKLVARANKSVDPADATRQAVAAMDLFEALAKMETALVEELDEAPTAAAVEAVDLDAMHAAFIRKHPEAFEPIGGRKAVHVATPPMHQWTCSDTLIELRGATPRVLTPLKPYPATGFELSWSDFFAGAGGSSSGLRAIPGSWVRLAVNHWDLAIETHQFNHQETDHDQASLARTDPSRYASTDLAWFSPECTHWSVAKGEKCDYDDELAEAIMDDEDDAPEAKEAKWRSRMLMRDVVRFSRHHQYKAVIVENVPDILKWGAMDRWLAEMVGEGYRYKIITLNSAFAAATGAPAPQLRDRVYFVFWKAQYRAPNWDKWLRPKGYCTSCDEIVPAIYTAKPGGRRPMRYGPRSQYTYRCPKKRCQGATVQPLVRPAVDAINWALPSQRIGDRKRPLAKKTYDRIEAGIRRHWPHAIVETAGHTFERRPGVRTWSVNQPLTTQHTTLSKSLASAPPPDGLLTPCGGGWNDAARPTSLPHVTTTGRENTALVMPLEGRAEVSAIRPVTGQFRSQTGRHQDGLLQHPESLMVPLRNNGNAEDPDGTPYRTFAANGNHHALVMRNNNSRGDVGGMCTPTDEPTRTFTANSKQSLIEHPAALVMRNNTGGAEMVTPTGEPIRTLTTGGHQSLIEHPDERIFSYDTGMLRPLAEPLPAQTTIEGDALFGIGGSRRLIEVDECYLRMLALEEVQEGMAFDSTYTLLGKAKRNKIKMLGNAVTPNAARDLGACVMEAITGIDMPLYDDDPSFWVLAA